MTTNLNESIDTIVELFDKYRDDPYMIQRIHHYICGKLPRIFDSIKTTYDINQIHEEEKQNNQDNFIQNFLNNNTYLYHSPTSTFYYYDHTHYQPYSEDDILHHVLSTLSKNRELSSWKKSTKIQIMCRIKQNALLKSIPNSETIQQVLESLKPFFSSKTETKYFLTILGDTVLKKNNGIFHFIKPKTKPFLRELDSLCLKTLNLHCTTTFKSKYYDHEYSACRFVPIIDSIANQGIAGLSHSLSIIDMICVAAHYSIRYESADRFIEKVNTDQSLLTYSFFIKDRTPTLIIQQFIQEYIEVLPVETTVAISSIPEIHIINWKNMFYLWKHFLDQHRVPTIIFQQNFKQILMTELSNNYDIGADQFHKVYSTFIPTIQQFLQFWNETISNSQESETYEIEEIVSLYKRWNPQSNLQDSVCLDLITYFFPGIEIIENKYICSIQCSLWLKREEIRKVIELVISENTGEKTTIYHLYEYYCRLQKNSSENALIISKQYFEKYIENNIEHYLNLFFIGDS